VIPTAYSYQVFDRAMHEILAYHWHPNSLSSVRHPHIHLSNRLGNIAIEPFGTTIGLSEMHIPTGFVTLADVVRLLIAEFGVEPRRADWESIVEQLPEQLHQER
jgi:hypothetical protein